MKKILIGILAVLGAAFAGCNEGGDPGTETRSNDKEQQPALTLVVPANTTVIATLDRRLSTETNRTGDPIALTTVEAIVRDGRTVVPAGSAIGGTLSDVEASGRVSGRAQMTLKFSSLTDADGQVHGLKAVPVVLQAESGTGTEMERVASGGVIGGGEGAATGMGSGTGVQEGVVVMMATQGDELVLEPGQKISVTFTSPLSIQVADHN